MQMEVLAPVGNYESLVAAVYSGADAVYFGAKEFNARRNADNFLGDSLRDSVLYCKQNGVKCYLTLNILIRDTEITEALLLAKKAADLGVDGIIVQDIGLARLIKKQLPKLPLHASTQLSIHSAAALPILKSLGFQRVVPAREMSKAELYEFCNEAKKLGIEVEVFVHGALCMSLSGQCYFSAHLGGRSANRGLCAGTCRLPFSCDGGTGYDLSLKDLCLIDKVAELKAMGVCSLKIEGRMKRPEYVAASVNCVKQAVEKGKVEKEDFALLEKVFSRSGFTDGYFNNTLGRDMFGIRTEQNLLQTDKALSKLHELYRRPKQRLRVDFDFKLLKDKPALLTATCGDFSVTEIGDIPKEAINKPTHEEAVRSALSRLGGTPYFLGTLSSELDNGLMLPISCINKLKSTVLSSLDKKRTALPIQNDLDYNFNAKAEKRDIKGFFLRFKSINQLCVFDKNVVGYSLPASVLTKFTSKEEMLTALKTDRLPLAELCRAAEDDCATLLTLNKLKSLGIETVVCSNLSTVELAKKADLKLFGGFGLNLYNSLSTKAAVDLGITKGVISAELSLKQQQYLSNPAFESYAFLYGRFPLMLTKNCPVKNGVGCKGKIEFCKLTDRKGEHFPVICENGYCEILNSRPTNIADQISLVSADYGYLYFTLEDKNEVQNIINGFKKGTVASIPFTRGLTKNGVG